MILGVTREFFYCQIINSVISCLEAVLLFKCLFKSKKNKWISWVISFLFFAPKLIELVLKAQIENGNAQFYGLYLLFSFVIMLWPFVLATAFDEKIVNSVFCVFFTNSINPIMYLMVYLSQVIMKMPQFSDISFIQNNVLLTLFKTVGNILFALIVKKIIAVRINKLPRGLVIGFDVFILLTQLVPIFTRHFTKDYFKMDYVFLYLSTFGVTVAFAAVVFFFYLKERSKNERLAAAAEYEEKKHNYLDVISDYSAKLSRMSHDITNHLRTVQVLSQRSGAPECIAYSEKLLEEYKDAAKSFCKEPLLNSMLLYYDSLSKKNGVNFVCDVSTGGNIAIDGVSLVTVFSNILDNAEEAAEKCAEGKRRIEFSLTADEFALSAVCKNSYNGELQKKGRGFSTTKANKNLHGLGISIVCDTVKNLGGKVDFQYDSSEFSATVYIPNTPKM